MRTLCLALLFILAGICLAHVQQNSGPNDGSAPGGPFPGLSAAWRKAFNPSAARSDKALAEENARLRAQLASRAAPAPGGSRVGSGTFSPTTLDQPAQYVGRWGTQYRSNIFLYKGTWYYSGTSTPVPLEQLRTERAYIEANQ